MNTNRDLNYRLFIQKENDFTRTDIHSEFEKYYAIRSGDVALVKDNYAKARLDFYKGKGQLSDDPLRNNIY
ncbi:MAG: AraC family transcriptional regulator, partial [Ruminococcus sp.]|nr:AraC family transcriptional regulator [Ruminococcus sp.]